MTTGRAFIEQYYDLVTRGDIEGLVALYGDAAEIVRYDGVAATPEEIRDYFVSDAERHPRASLRSIDQVREADDVLMWDALVDTENGTVQVVHVMTFDEDGSIRRHVPGMRGYWGR